jgi:hypothetical protein
MTATQKRVRVPALYLDEHHGVPREMLEENAEMLAAGTHFLRQRALAEGGYDYALVPLSMRAVKAAVDNPDKLSEFTRTAMLVAASMRLHRHNLLHP